MYYKKSHHAWYVNRHGKAVRLGTTETKAQAALGGTLQTVGQAVQQFLARPMSPGNLSFYTQSLKGLPDMPISDLRPFHATGCRNAMRAAKTCFKWCEEQGYINVSPLRNLKLPAATRRGDDVYLTTEQITRLMDYCPADLLDLLVALHETGCRPQEARLVTAKNLDGMCWSFARGKGGVPRVVHLSSRVYEICRRLALKRPEGPLFRNSRGKGWSTAALVGRFERLAKRVGFPVTAYSLRHTFTTNALERGVDPITLCTLLGHSSLKMVHQCYAHLQRRAAHLQKAVEQAVDTSRRSA
jgi:integrase